MFFVFCVFARERANKGEGEYLRKNLQFLASALAEKSNISSRSVR